MGAGVRTTPGMLSARNATLKELIEGVYAVENYQVTGGPVWLESARFDVDAKPGSATGREQMLAMMRLVLTDRFKLAIHRETKDLSVYAMVLTKGGPKFKKSPQRDETTPLGFNNLGRNTDMASFARYLTRFGSDLPVIDKTGLTGNYDLDLDMRKIASAAVTPGADTAPGIGAIFQATVDAMESIGLKLVRTKAPVEILVIDHAEQPSRN
jgi:uncharacterized protein (TIGR03435 family)